jgi:hypothetical protein
VLAARIVLGIVYGVALYWAFDMLTRREPLYGFEKGDNWNRFIEIARLMASLAPLPLLFGLGGMPAARLGLWSFGAAAALLIFGWYGPATVWESVDGLINVWLFSLIVLFIAHEFIQSALDDDRALADYKTYFENAWGRGFQVVLALVFLGAYWIVISLGAWMFDLIGLDFIRRAVFSGEFGWISSGLVFAVGAHLAGADIGLTRGARQIGLMLLSWLAVLMTFILAAFLIALLFTGLQPLWDTGAATVLLLNAAATMILLINAAYQDGAYAAPRFMRATIRLAAAPLAGVVILAALGLWLRVNQYGFTPARVLAATELFIVSVYAVGYAAAALKPGRWMRLLEPVNIAAAIAVAALLSALMTPVLSPARVSVASQLSRIERGAVEPDAFDFNFLLSARAGKWGERALERLAARSGSPRDDRIAFLAANPGERRFGYSDQSLQSRRGGLRLLGAGDIPDGVLLPRTGFDPVARCLEQKRLFDRNVIEYEEIMALPERLRPARYVAYKEEDRPFGDGRCLLRLLDIDQDGDEDAIIMAANASTFAGADVLLQEDEPAWRHVGNVAVRHGFGDEASHSALNDLEDDERQAALADMLREAGAKRAPYNDIVSKDVRIQLLLDRKILNREEMRAPIAMEDDREAPAAVLLDGPTYHNAVSCAMNEGRPHNRVRCFGRYLDVADGAPPEFVIIKFAGSSVTVQAFEESGDGWGFIGEGEGRFPAMYDELKKELLKSGSKTNDDVDAAFAETFLAHMQLSAPLCSDIVSGDLQFSVEYLDERRRR